MRVENHLSDHNRNTTQRERPPTSSQEVGKFNLIREASQELFQPFTHACAAHSEHLVLLSLNTTYDYSDKQSPFFQMNFHFALSQPRSLPASISTTNTACGDSSHSTVERNSWFKVETYAIDLQRRLPHFGNRSAGPSVDISEQLHSVSLTGANPKSTHIEVSRTRDFCAQVGFLSQSRPHENSTNPWVAVLGQSSTYTHLIRGPSHFANTKCPTLPISMNELIQSSNSSQALTISCHCSTVSDSRNP